MSEPRLDLVIAVHTPERPVERAVLSVLQSAGPRAHDVRVTVVCHGIDTALIAARLPAELLAQVRLLHLVDGVPSPAGPLNAGVAAASADYVAVMGSDDFFEPRAVRAYLDRVDRDRPDVLLVPLRPQGGEVLRNPLPRLGRRRRLDPVRDRLLYRSAPLALIRRELLQSIPGPFLERMPTGEDLELGVRLWTSGVRIDLGADLPAYVIGEDAGDRVSTAPRPLSVVLAPIDLLLERPWVAALNEPVRRSLGIKLLRIHVLGALRARRDVDLASEPDARMLVSVARGCAALAPGVLAPFARAERRVLEALIAQPEHEAQSSLERALGELTRAEGAAWRDRTLPASIARCLDRESTLTRFLLYRLDRWRRS